MLGSYATCDKCTRATEEKASKSRMPRGDDKISHPQAVSGANMETFI